MIESRGYSIQHDSYHSQGERVDSRLIPLVQKWSESSDPLYAQVVSRVGVVAIQVIMTAQLAGTIVLMPLAILAGTVRSLVDLVGMQKIHLTRNFLEAHREIDCLRTLIKTMLLCNPRIFLAPNTLVERYIAADIYDRETLLRWLESIHVPLTPRNIALLTLAGHLLWTRIRKLDEEAILIGTAQLPLWRELAGAIPILTAPAHHLFKALPMSAENQRWGHTVFGAPVIEHFVYRIGVQKLLLTSLPRRLLPTRFKHWVDNPAACVIRVVATAALWHQAVCTFSFRDLERRGFDDDFYRILISSDATFMGLLYSGVSEIGNRASWIALVTHSLYNRDHSRISNRILRTVSIEEYT